MAETICVSISRQQKEWLEATKGSPSKMLQDQINAEIRASNDALAPNLKEAHARIRALTLKLAEVTQSNHTTATESPRRSLTSLD